MLADSDNCDVKIDLFQRMLEMNAMTFNPAGCRTFGRWMCMRMYVTFKSGLKAAGVTFVGEAHKCSTGPANCIVLKPDGNPVLLDQHVRRLGRWCAYAVAHINLNGLTTVSDLQGQITARTRL